MDFEGKWTKFVNLLCTFASFILFPCVLIFILLPLHIWRCFVGFLGIYIFRRGHLLKLVNPRSALMAVDRISTNPTWNIVVPMIHEGLWELEEFRRNMLAKHVQVKDPSGGRELYPELRQYFERWWGYLFWIQEESFDINEHVNLYQVEEGASTELIGNAGLYRIIKELLEKPFTPRKSPWEVILLYNHVPDDLRIKGEDPKVYTTIIFRIHHAVVDGSSIMKLLLQDNDQGAGKMAIPKANGVRRNQGRALLYGLTFPLRAPYEFVSISRRNLGDPHKWAQKGVNITSTKRYIDSTILPSPQFKLAKDHLRVTFTSALIASVTGGLRNFLLRNNIGFPETISCGMPFPFPTRSKKLRNYFAFAAISLPLGENDPEKRALLIDKQLKDVKSSTFPLSSFTLMPMFGSLPAFLIKALGKHTQSLSCIISYMPGPTIQTTNKGSALNDCFFVGGVGSGKTGLMLSISSYGDKMHISAGLDSGLVGSDEKVGEFLECVREEIEILKNCQIKRILNGETV